MNEHTSLELSKRLWAKGFRGEHTHVWTFADGAINRNIFMLSQTKNDFIPNGIPAWTFTEIWREMDNTDRLMLLIHMTSSSKVHRNDIAEVAGEWLIDNGHYNAEVE